MSAPTPADENRYASVRASVLLICGLLLHALALAQKGSVLAIAVGERGDASYRIGQKLAAGLEAGGQMQVELWESLRPAERLVVLLDEVSIAIVPAGNPLPEDARQAIGGEPRRW